MIKDNDSEKNFKWLVNFLSLGREMPIWVPPSPPHDDNDVYIDRTLALCYEMVPMSEDRLPPVWVNAKDSKKIKMDAGTAGALTLAGLKTESYCPGNAEVREKCLIFMEPRSFSKQEAHTHPHTHTHTPSDVEE